MKIYYKHLLRTDATSLFKYTKHGITLNIRGTAWNLTEKSRDDLAGTLDYLEEMLDGELTYQQRQDVNEVIQELKNPIN